MKRRKNILMKLIEIVNNKRRNIMRKRWIIITLNKIKIQIKLLILKHNIEVEPDKIMKTLGMMVMTRNNKINKMWEIIVEIK